MQINWAGLGSVLVVGLVAAVVFVSLFAVGVDALGRRSAGRSVALSTVVTVLCFAACVGVVGFGLYKIVVH